MNFQLSPTLVDSAILELRPAPWQKWAMTPMPLVVCGSFFATLWFLGDSTLHFTRAQLDARRASFDAPMKLLF